MKIEYIIILSIVIITSCKIKYKTVETNKSESIDTRELPQNKFDRYYTLYEISNNKFAGPDTFVTTHYLNGKIQSKGKFAKNREGEVSYFKIDLFENYHENGKLQEKGKYEIGRYTQCCTGGLCSQFYNYKLGVWKYYFPNGNPKATVFYEPKIFQINTSCKDGDQIRFGQINLDESKFWNETGQRIEPPIELINELETVVNNEDYNSKSLSIQNGKVRLEVIANQK